MGKHSKEKIKEKKEKKQKQDSKKKYNIVRYIIWGIVIALLVVTGIYVYQNFNKFRNIVPQENSNVDKEYKDSIKNSTTVENEILVIKSLFEYNKIIQYTFEEDTLKTVIIYQQFEEQEKFKNKKASYEKQDNIIIKNIDEKELSIEIEKTEFGTDTELSYEELCDKYLVQMIGAYEKI